MMSERKSGHVCAVKSCCNKRYNCKKRFFSFPRQRDRARLWVIKANREDLYEKLGSLHKSHRLCEDHFEHRMFTNFLRERLSANAFPTLFPSLEGSSGDGDHAYSRPSLLPANIQVFEDQVIVPALSEETPQASLASTKQKPYLEEYMNFLKPFETSRKSKGNAKGGDESDEDAKSSECEPFDTSQCADTTLMEDGRKIEENILECPERGEVFDDQLESQQGKQNEVAQPQQDGPSQVRTRRHENLEPHERMSVKKRKLRSKETVATDDVHSGQSYYDWKLESEESSVPDPDTSFLISVIPDMHAMNPEQKRRFKMGILNLASEILSETPQMSVSPSSRCTSSASQISVDQKPIVPSELWNSTQQGVASFTGSDEELDQKFLFEATDHPLVKAELDLS